MIFRQRVAASADALRVRSCFDSPLEGSHAPKTAKTKGIRRPVSRVSQISSVVVTQISSSGGPSFDGGGFGGSDQASLKFVLQAIGVASYIHGDGMVQDPIQDRGGNHPIPEDL